MDNLVLIGMPSVGKSAAGKLLAKDLGYAFLDSDDLIRAAAGTSLSALIEDRGTDGFLAVENAVNCAISVHNTVIATGGSVVYCEQAMRHLKSIGTVVYLATTAEEVERRVTNFTARGVVMRGNITNAKQLFFERAPLYEMYADLTVDCGGKSMNEIAAEVAQRLI